MSNISAVCKIMLHDDAWEMLTGHFILLGAVDEESYQSSLMSKHVTDPLIHWRIAGQCDHLPCLPLKSVHMYVGAVPAVAMVMVAKNKCNLNGKKMSL